MIRRVFKLGTTVIPIIPEFSKTILASAKCLFEEESVRYIPTTDNNKHNYCVNM